MMKRPFPTPRSAVEALVAAARRVSDRRHHWREAFLADTGLSWEGICLALDHCLETQPSSRELEAMVGSAEPTSRVAVVLSANVFTSALRALAVARAAAPRVHVRPSRRSSSFAKALWEESEDNGLVWDPDLVLAQWPEGEIHIYGRDATVGQVVRQARTGVTVRGHGTGMGIGIVRTHGGPPPSMVDVAFDIVAFDQRGCMSPRVYFIEGTPDDALAFLHDLHRELEAWGQRVPRGSLSQEEWAEVRRFRDAWVYGGVYLEGSSHGLALAADAWVLPPTGRHVVVVPVPSVDEVPSRLGPLLPHVVCVGSNDPGTLRLWFPPGVRHVPLGSMQRPFFDGPVDLRVRSRGVPVEVDAQPPTAFRPGAVLAPFPSATGS